MCRYRRVIHLQDDKGDERSKTCLGQYCNSSGSNYIIMEDLLVRVNMAALSLLATKTPQAGDVNANFAELKAVINGLKTEKEVMMATIAEFRVIVPLLYGGKISIREITNVQQTHLHVNEKSVTIKSTKN